MPKRVLTLLLILCNSLFIYAQESVKKPFDVDIQYFYGNILEHSKDIAHLITEHPKGVILSYNRKTYGLNEWERRYNYPDWGFSFMYQDFGNEIHILVNNAGLGYFGFVEDTSDKEIREMFETKSSDCVAKYRIICYLSDPVIVRFLSTGSHKI